LIQINSGTAVATERKEKNTMASFHNSEAVVIDNGTGFLKAGFAGEDSPQVVLPTTTNFLQKLQMGNKRDDDDSNNDGSLGGGNGNSGDTDSKTNSSSMHTASAAAYKRPIRRGKIEDWDSMTAAWRYLLQHELGLDPEAPEFPVVLTDSPLSSRKDREKMAEIMFETFNVPGMYVGSQAVFSLYASGRTRGLVLECGDGVTHAVPIFEGFALPHATNRMELAGGDLTTMIRGRLAERGISFTRSEAHSNIVRNIKETLCQVSLKYEEESRAKENLQ
jgi:actin-related protein